MSERSEANCVSNDLVERVALAIDSAICDGDQSSVAMELTSEEIKVLARAAIAVCMEEAAKVCISVSTDALTKVGREHEPYMRATAEDCAAAIRALVKEPT